MPYREVVETIEFPAGATERYKRLNALRRLLDNTIYDDIPYSFSQEKTDGGTYIPLLKRRPSAPFNLARIVVDQSSGLLWGGEQMPYVECGTQSDEAARKKRKADRENLSSLVLNCALDALMMEVYEAAAPGSAAIIVRADADKQPIFSVIWGEEALPVYDPRNPTKLVSLIQVYPTTAQELTSAGVTQDSAGNAISQTPKENYWCRVEYDARVERRFFPLKAEEYARLGEKRSDGTKIAWAVNPEAIYPHNWGEVNVIWARNLIGGSGPDGRCTYGDIADIQVEIAYLLSQIGRGYRYTADPLLVRSKGELANALGDPDPFGDNEDLGLRSASDELRGPNGETVRGAANIMDVGEGGDAKLLEISGEGLKAAGEHVKQLREWALEVVGAMKSDASTTKGIQSGRALEMLYQALQLLLKRQRIAFGTRVFLPLLRLLLRGCAKGVLEIDGVVEPDVDAHLTLKWPQWMTPRAADLLATAQAYETMAGGSQKEPVVLIPPARAAAALASELGYQDPGDVVEELRALQGAQEDDDEEDPSLGNSQ